MGRLVKLALIAGAIYVGIEIYNQGLERAFGGLLAPLASSSAEGEGERDATSSVLDETFPYSSSRPGDRDGPKVPITDAVRERLGGDTSNAEQRQLEAERAAGL
jgi:hypothetical protein